MGLTISCTACAQEWEYRWTRTFGSIQAEDIQGLNVDTTGNLYVVRANDWWID